MPVDHDNSFNVVICFLIFIFVFLFVCLSIFLPLFFFRWPCVLIGGRIFRAILEIGGDRMMFDGAGETFLSVMVDFVTMQRSEELPIKVSLRPSTACFYILADNDLLVKKMPLYFKDHK